MDILAKRLTKIAEDVENSNKKIQLYNKMRKNLAEFKSAYYNLLNTWQTGDIERKVWISGKMNADDYPFFVASFDELEIPEFCDDFDKALEEVIEEENARE